MATPSLNIFVVENHPDTLSYLTEYLQAGGHEVRCARNHAEAVQALSLSPAEVVVCDISLGDSDGWELMKEIAASQVPPPFGIAMSGYGSPADIAKSRAVGYRCHLVKPFLPQELDAIIDEAIRERAAYFAADTSVSPEMNDQVVQTNP